MSTAKAIIERPLQQLARAAELLLSKKREESISGVSNTTNPPNFEQTDEEFEYV
jgi:hypothetical protein